MKKNSVIWLTSYPRSGNTMLRTILWHCFGQRSASVYPRDLGGNHKLEEYVGHIEHDGPDGRIRFPENNLPLFKTHEHATDNNAAIYVIRDGRAVMMSLWNFYKGEIPLETFITGQYRFGTWSDHVQSWAPNERPDTLALKYETMRSDLPGTLKEISSFLQKEIMKTDIPDRNTIANAEGRWVRKKSDWRLDFPQDKLEKFNEQNADLLTRMGYLI